MTTVLLDKPPVRVLLAKYFAFHWQTRCVPEEAVPKMLEDGWLNYMRDPFDLDAVRQWEADRDWALYLATRAHIKPARKRPDD